jgi:hypothetical protein
MSDKSYTSTPTVRLNRVKSDKSLCLKTSEINRQKDIYWFFILYIQHHWIGNDELRYFIEIIRMYNYRIYCNQLLHTLLYWDRVMSLSLCHGATSGFGWRMAFNMEDSCEYIE